MDAVRSKPLISKRGCLAAASCALLLLIATNLSARAQDSNARPNGSAPAQVQQQSSAPSANSQLKKDASSPSSTPAQDRDLPEKNPVVSAGTFSLQTTDGEIKEDALRQLLTGNPLYLRQGYQDNDLEFDEAGRLTSHARQGSFTLSQIQINKVKVSKHKIELEGDRYALHFLGAAPYEDPTKATDRVKITPKKKTVRISFEREQVEKPKKDKDKKQKRDDQSASKTSGPSVATTGNASSPRPGTPANQSQPARINDKETSSSAHASQLLVAALDKVFSRGIDDRMIAAMPDFWKLYYQAAAAKADYKPTDPGVLPQAAVDQKAKLISALDPPSNEFAQANGVAGIALYHAIIGSNGKVEEVVAGRPIGFGLDENAEQTIRKATFQPAMKQGKAVPVALDLVVSFRIYSKRTSEPEAQQTQTAASSEQSTLPGPYTAQAMEQARNQAPQQANQQDQASQQDSSAQTVETAQPATASAQNSAPPQSPSPRK